MYCFQRYRIRKACQTARRTEIFLFQMQGIMQIYANIYSNLRIIYQLFAHLISESSHPILRAIQLNIYNFASFIVKILAFITTAQIL